MLNRRTVLLASIGISLLFSGCSDGKGQKPVFKVRGKVTFDGKPVAKANISFISTDETQRDLQPKGITDENGEYILSSYLTQDGAPLGEYLVTLYWPGPPRPPARGDAKTVKPVPGSPEAEDESLPPDRFKDAYRYIHKTKLKATVAGRDNEINFNLP